MEKRGPLRLRALLPDLRPLAAHPSPRTPHLFLSRRKTRKIPPVLSSASRDKVRWDREFVLGKGRYGRLDALDVTTDKSGLFLINLWWATLFWGAKRVKNRAI
jgi:hypothetical protein